MKDKIFAFIIGFLIGAIITASGFLIYQKVTRGNNQMPNNRQMQMMEKSDGQMPPERPNKMENDENRPQENDTTRSQDNNGKRPQAKSNNNSSVNDETV